MICAQSTTEAYVRNMHCSRRGPRVRIKWTNGFSSALVASLSTRPVDLFGGFKLGETVYLDVVDATLPHGAQGKICGHPNQYLLEVHIIES